MLGILVIEFKVSCYQASKMLQISYANAKLIVRNLKSSQDADASHEHLMDRIHNSDDYASICQESFKIILKHIFREDESAFKPKFGVEFFQTNIDRLLIEPLLVKYCKTLRTLRSFPVHTDKLGKTRITLPPPPAYKKDYQGSLQKKYDAIPKDIPSVERLSEDSQIIVR